MQGLDPKSRMAKGLRILSPKGSAWRTAWRGILEAFIERRAVAYSKNQGLVGKCRR